ncbi:hypothetical protein V2J09_006733 [Rumex salicifolius]
MAMVLYRPRKESTRKPPSKQRRKDVPMKSVTMLADVELRRCIVLTGKGAKAHTKVTQGGPKDRKSGAGVTGSPKKGGHGGKYTWSGDGDHLQYQASDVAMDVKDPNFEDADEVTTTSHIAFSTSFRIRKSESLFALFGSRVFRVLDQLLTKLHSQILWLNSRGNYGEHTKSQNR